MKYTIKSILQAVSVAIFFLFFTVLLLVLLALPKQKVSETENKELATFPKFSLSSLTSGSFMQGFDRYISDHFPGRPWWIGTKTEMELSLGKKEISGVYVLKNRLVLQVKEPDPAIVNDSVAAIGAFAERHAATPVQLMLVPTAQEIYRSELPENAPAANQANFIDDVYQRLKRSKVLGVDVMNTLSSAKSEPIYFRTDHHWTPLGAYYGYSAFIKQSGAGASAIPLSSFDVEHVSDDFLGTLHSKTLYTGVEPDSISFYHMPEGASVLSVKAQGKDGIVERDSLYFRENLETKDQYAAFLGGNYSRVDITTDAKSENRLLIIKDSYANAMIPFLTQHYREITLLDPRYFNTRYAELVDVDSYSQVLFLYNVSTFMEDTSIRKLGAE